MRQPRITGAAGRTRTSGRFRLSPSSAKKRTVSSIPTGPGEAAIAQEAGDDAQRILVLVPDPDVGGDLQRLADRRLLEMGRDDARLAVAGEDRGGEALAAMPLDAGEIDHRRAGLDQDRGKALLPHQRLGAGDALLMLLARNRDHPAGHRRQRPRRLLGEQPRRACQQGGRAAHREEMAPARHHRPATGAGVAAVNSGPPNARAR
jgi:hypothetical protein